MSDKLKYSRPLSIQGIFSVSGAGLKLKLKHGAIKKTEPNALNQLDG